jgi:hypothetical protein
LIGRRGIISAGLLAGAMLPSSASATRAPKPKDHAGYSATIDRLFAAWWDRDYAAFEPAFIDAGVAEPFDGRALFDAHYAKRQARFRGELCFNGASVVAQVITPQGPDYERGILGGYALGDLFLVRFFPGLEKPVVETLSYIDTDVLAHVEWLGLPNAPHD